VKFPGAYKDTDEYANFIEVSLFTFNTSLGMAYRRVCDDLTAQARLLLPRDSAKHE